jgi:hydrogenase maturation protease
MKPDHPRVLLIGYGNPGRQDDGLGPALAEELQKRAIESLDVDADYQLTVEDACAAAEHDVVIFADAALQGAAPFVFRRVDPLGRRPGCGSHTMEPEEVAGLAQELFGAKTAFYALAIRGYEFDEYEETLSDNARDNLAKALSFIDEVLRNGAFETVALPPDSEDAGDRKTITAAASCN